MIVSGLSFVLRGSNRTRLLKHGMDGHTDEIVAVSWMAKPWGRSSRWVSVRRPPGLAARAGTGTVTAAASNPTPPSRTIRRIEIIVDTFPEPAGRYPAACQSPRLSGGRGQPRGFRYQYLDPQGELSPLAR